MRQNFRFRALKLLFAILMPLSSVFPFPHKFSYFKFVWAHGGIGYKKILTKNSLDFLVQATGLEPACSLIRTLEPESSASANSAMPANIKL